jgi:alkylation response protein AidB-like acyl-CoA dehydrogenase
MNLSYTDEQNLLRDSVSRFCGSDYDFETRMKSVNSDLGHNPDHWKLFAELGWLAIPFSEEMGGLEGGDVDLSLMFEEFGKSIVVEPYLANVVLSGGVLKRCDHENKSALVESLIAGESQFSLANYEPKKGFNLDAVDCEISPDGTVNGYKTTVLNAPNADHFLVFGKHDSGYAFALVSKNSEGLSLTPYKTYDGFVSGDLKLENVRSEAVFSKNDALEILNQAILEGIICVSSEAIGAMEKCYKLTIEYTQQREQFGQSLSKFQALQHRMVDMFMETEFSKSYLLKVLATDDANERAKLVYGLKNQVAKAGKLVGEEAVQLHGGMGVTEEMSVGHYLKRLLVITNLFGSSDYFLNKYIES